MAEVIELHKLKLAELRQECDARGLETKGNKGDLVARLQAYLDEHDEDVDVDEVLADDTADFPKGEIVDNGKDVKESPSPVAKLSAEKKMVKICPPATGGEQLQKRAERFNLPASAEDKKARRAARFGLAIGASDASTGAAVARNVPVNVDQLKKRAERFGMNVSSLSQKLEADEKLMKRKERFGILTGGGTAGSADVEAKKLKRAARFGIV
ncbi:SAP domain-containing ribonucleoprotein-like isoform X2 [Hippocampus zosterae]|uniref:SAP domain-containing ribonucleoprotein-like isoform X2 n=1 Tax=Hippocampus zosterae TaxID=109293 RepID=UPI00223E0820|nr:SAP domain-containing ribonucleoprotein-like isoform X2 [Hippocampus zosterae]XP_051914343.1 SAP domain-containing ribonucleoprotein-like isoform X2 [Hippocampus zosterae]